MAYRLLWNNILYQLQECIVNGNNTYDCNQDIITNYNSHKIPYNGISKQYTCIQLSKGQEEKAIQKLVQNQLELLTGKQIVTENSMGDINQETRGYFLKDKLMEAIKRINHNSIEKDINNAIHNNIISNSSEIVYEDIVEYLAATIIRNALRIMDKPDNSTKLKGVKLYNFYFKTHRIKYRDICFHINLIDVNSNLYNHENKNEITIVRERNLRINDRREIPDFAIFFNGLPFIAVELKRLSVDGFSGEYVAHRDYMNKKSYHNFLSFIGSNGINAFISSNPKMNSFYLWSEYDKNNTEYEKTPRTDNNGLYDIIIDLLVDPKKFLFYFESCTMPSETRTQYLKNARIQQFRTAYKFFELLNTKEKQNIRRYFQHHARTGKTFTFKILAKMLWKKKVGGFQKVIFFVPDMSSVYPSIKKEFANLEFPNGEACKIETREEYRTELSKTGKDFYFYIANMQLINESDIIDDRDDVMMLVDEVHIFQKTDSNNVEECKQTYQTLADKRKEHFPNASYISATASPLIEVLKDGTQVDITEITYGKCIDTLTPMAAINLRLVTPLIYVKNKFSIDDSFITDLKSNNTQPGNILNDANIRQSINAINDKKEDFLDRFEKKNGMVSDNFKGYYYNDDFIRLPDQMENPFPKDDNDYDVMNKFLSYIKGILKNDIIGKIGAYNSIFEHNIWEGLLKYKVEYVVSNIEKLRNQYKDFMPKSFYMVPPKRANDNIVPGLIMVNTIRNMITQYINANPDCDKKDFDTDLVIYKGVRFAFDGSGNETDQTESIEITRQFENDERIHRTCDMKPIDVLILVRKKTRGYDNANLIDVYLDRKLGKDNYQEMLQISTRGTTMRDDKQYSRLIDLTHGDDNHELYNRTMSIYNKDGMNESGAIDDSVIVNIMDNIESSINKFIMSIKNHNDDNITSIQDFINDVNIRDYIINGIKNEDCIKHNFVSCMNYINSELKKVPFSINNFMVEYDRTELLLALKKLLSIYTLYNVEQIDGYRSRLHTNYFLAVKEILDTVFPDKNGYEGISERIKNITAALTHSNEYSDYKTPGTEIDDGETSSASGGENNRLPHMQNPDDVILNRYQDILQNNERFNHIDNEKDKKCVQIIFNHICNMMIQKGMDTDTMQLIAQRFSELLHETLNGKKELEKLNEKKFTTNKLSMRNVFNRINSGDIEEGDLKSFKNFIQDERAKYDKSLKDDVTQASLYPIFKLYMKP